MTFKESILKDAEKRKQNIQEYKEQIKEIDRCQQELPTGDNPNEHFLRRYMHERKEWLQGLKKAAESALNEDLKVLGIMEEMGQG